MVESSPNTFTRRDILKGAVTASIAVAFSGVVPDNVEAEKYCEFVGQVGDKEKADDQIVALKGLIDRDFHVAAVETEEAYRLRGAEYTSFNPNAVFGLASRSWSKKTLRLLYNTLANLPEHFMNEEVEQDPVRSLAITLLGGNTTEKVSIALDYLSTPMSNCQCLGEYGSDMFPGIVRNPDVILLDSMNFFPKKTGGNDLSMRLVTHEFIHRYDIDVAYARAWSDFENVLGGNYREVAPKVRKRLQQVDPTKLVSIEALAYDRLAYGFSEEHNNFAEVVATFGEVYLYNESYFNKGVSLYLGRDTSSELYGLMRDNIFRGKEYEAFPQVCG